MHIGMTFLIVVVASAVVSCGGSHVESDERSTSDASATEIAFLTRSSQPEEEIIMAAGPDLGRLEIDPNTGCVTLSGKAVVWPKGSELRTDPLRIVLPGGLTAHPGDELVGSGGEVPLDGVLQPAFGGIEGDIDRAVACSTQGDQRLFVVNASGLEVRMK